MNAIPPPPAAVMQAAASTEREIRNAEKTVREVIPPWHVSNEKKENEEKPAAEIEEALDDADLLEEAPPSGVRVSDPGPPPALPSDAPCTYRVYTLADLDAPVSYRASRLSFDVTASRGPSHLRRVRGALFAFAIACKDWLKIRGERPHPFVALRQPFDTLGDELQAWVQSIDWKRVGIHTGTAVGASLALLFAVLTVAELTDDLKPAAGARLASTEIVGPPPPPALTSLPGAGNLASAVQAPPVVTVSEPVDEPEPEKDVPEATKKAKKAKPKPKLTFRDANEVFSP
ncbi:MAG: hypothetical protein KF819_19835 [Labilithrix sp.]|nr:hypothetical protein [Labilithrix sp.]